jgi:hypothetical protein
MGAAPVLVGGMVIECGVVVVVTLSWAMTLAMTNVI